LSVFTADVAGKRVQSGETMMSAAKGLSLLGAGVLGLVLVLGLVPQADAQPIWTQLSPTGGLPGIRAGAAGTYDPVTNTMTVFGGTHGSNGAQLNDVWVL